MFAGGRGAGRAWCWLVAPEANSKGWVRTSFYEVLHTIWAAHLLANHAAHNSRRRRCRHRQLAAAAAAGCCGAAEAAGTVSRISTLLHQSTACLLCCLAAGLRFCNFTFGKVSHARPQRR